MIASQFCTAHQQAMNAYMNGCIVISEERIYLDFDISVNDYQFKTVEPLLIDTSQSIMDSSLWSKKYFTITINSIAIIIMDSIYTLCCYVDNNFG